MAPLPPASLPRFRTERALALLLLFWPPACHREDSSASTGDSAGPSASAQSDGMSSPFDPARTPNRLAPPDEQFGPKEWATTDDYRMRFTEVRECEVESYFAPQPGHVKLGVQLEIEGLSKNEVPSNQLHAVLLDSEGTRYAATLAGCKPSLPTARVIRGKMAAGLVTFDVPKDAHGFVLRYEPVVIGRADSSLSFTLGR